MNLERKNTTQSSLEEKEIKNPISPDKQINLEISTIKNEIGDMEHELADLATIENTHPKINEIKTEASFLSKKLDTIKSNLIKVLVGLAIIIPKDAKTQDISNTKEDFKINYTPPDDFYHKLNGEYGIKPLKNPTKLNTDVYNKSLSPISNNRETQVELDKLLNVGQSTSTKEDTLNYLGLSELLKQTGNPDIVIDNTISSYKNSHNKENKELASYDVVNKNINLPKYDTLETDYKDLNADYRYAHIRNKTSSLITQEAAHSKSLTVDKFVPDEEYLKKVMEYKKDPNSYLDEKGNSYREPFDKMEEYKIPGFQEHQAHTRIAPRLFKWLSDFKDKNRVEENTKALPTSDLEKVNKYQDSLTLYNNTKDFLRYYNKQGFPLDVKTVKEKNLEYLKEFQEKYRKYLPTLDSFSKKNPNVIEHYIDEKGQTQEFENNISRENPIFSHTNENGMQYSTPNYHVMKEEFEDEKNPNLNFGNQHYVDRYNGFLAKSKNIPKGFNPVYDLNQDIVDIDAPTPLQKESIPFDVLYETYKKGSYCTGCFGHDTKIPGYLPESIKPKQPYYYRPDGTEIK